MPAGIHIHQCIDGILIGGDSKEQGGQVAGDTVLGVEVIGGLSVATAVSAATGDQMVKAL